MKACSLLAAALLLSGCAIGTTVDPYGVETKHYFGYVAVQRPPASERVFSRDTAAVGVSFERGLGVGYMRDRQWAIPLDCRMVFVVTGQSEIDQVLATLKNNESLRGACAVLETGP